MERCYAVSGALSGLCGCRFEWLTFPKTLESLNLLLRRRDDVKQPECDGNFHEQFDRSCPLHNLIPIGTPARSFASVIGVSSNQYF